MTKTCQKAVQIFSSIDADVVLLDPKQLNLKKRSKPLIVKNDDFEMSVFENLKSNGLKNWRIFILKVY